MGEHPTADQVSALGCLILVGNLFMGEIECEKQSWTLPWQQLITPHFPPWDASLICITLA